MSDEERQRPRTHAPLDLAGVVRAHSRDVSSRYCRSASPRASGHPHLQAHLFAKSRSRRDDVRTISSRCGHPRAGLCASRAERAATAAKNAQQARISVIPRSRSDRPSVSLRRDGQERDAPKSVDPVPTFSSTISSGRLRRIARQPGQARDRPIARPIRLERL